MKVVIVESPGGPERLTLAERPDPEPGQNELLVDVHATALNRADLLQRRGLYPPPPGATDILGLECSGTVSALGKGTSLAKLGDRVMALLPGGGYQEKVVIPEGMAMPIPEELNFEQAAAVPEAFLTASEALFSVAGLGIGQTLLVHAAASGVGTAAIQLARLKGARVIGTAGREAKRKLAEKLGCQLSIDYKNQDFAEVLQQRQIEVDVVLDFVGKDNLDRNLRCLTTNGRLVVLGLLSGAKAQIDLGLVLRNRLSILGLVMRTRPLSEKIAITRAFVRNYLPHFETGRLFPIVDTVLPLAQVRAAHGRMEANDNAGKIVLKVR